MKPDHGDLRVWWIPQVPGKPFHVAVDSLNEAQFLLTVLAEYDIFQFENRIKPDFANAGGIEVWNELLEPVDGSKWMSIEDDTEQSELEEILAEEELQEIST